jgi:hypothetical protein
MCLCVLKCIFLCGVTFNYPRNITALKFTTAKYSYFYVRSVEKRKSSIRITLFLILQRLPGTRLGVSKCVPTIGIGIEC